MRMLVVVMVLLFGLGHAGCLHGQMKTNHKTRNVYQCDGVKWKFHGKMLRPRGEGEDKPIMALISNKCSKNPDMQGTISGYHCDTRCEMAVLECLNTKIVYMCHNHKWSIYQVLNSKN